ncbi:MAG: hypothetical protein J07HQW2_00696 [Haloquadratum walsbyi J07HQW2]|uniref:Uncharacterized protein n=1 Tax=Haloquadratum walsbyi J07HQW2 TaxID=1238425 RepID=U1PKP6_9EURY|nr:MAG: hypothetical protein J07HQW2_00696 [Haloquadratum walsbyi J07HQW2]
MNYLKPETPVRMKIPVMFGKNLAGDVTTAVTTTEA